MKDGAVIDQKETEELVQLIARFQRPLSVYLRTLIPQRADAEDVLQEVNLFIWRHAHEYRPGTDFGSWAYKIAYYTVLTYRKRMARQKLRFGDDLFEQLAAGAAAATEHADRRLDVLEGCLQKLPERDRELVCLRYESNCSTQAVADRVGRSVKSVYHALARIHTSLLDCVRQSLRAEVEA
jgi:RNA polymerase sigma-70 factor (ECF subfamily)